MAWRDLVESTGEVAIGAVASDLSISEDEVMRFVTTRNGARYVGGTSRYLIWQEDAEALENSPREKLALFDGQGKEYSIGLPKLIWLGAINGVALAHVAKNTGLEFQDCGPKRFSAQPTSSDQIVRLMMTYNVKTQYHNNATWRNTLFLKNDHHVGFKVDSICYECAVENNINLSGLEPGDRLAC